MSTCSPHISLYPLGIWTRTHVYPVSLYPLVTPHLFRTPLACEHMSPLPNIYTHLACEHISPTHFSLYPLGMWAHIHPTSPYTPWHMNTHMFNPSLYTPLLPHISFIPHWHVNTCPPTHVYPTSLYTTLACEHMSPAKSLYTHPLACEHMFTLHLFIPHWHVNTCLPSQISLYPFGMWTHVYPTSFYIPLACEHMSPLSNLFIPTWHVNTCLPHIFLHPLGMWTHVPPPKSLYTPLACEHMFLPNLFIPTWHMNTCSPIISYIPPWTIHQITTFAYISYFIFLHIVRHILVSPASNDPHPIYCI